MQRKLAFLLCALSALIAVNQAHAQSSHDAASGADADLAERTGNDFSIGTADGKFKMRFRGHVQQNNQFTYNPQQKKAGLDMAIKRARISLTGNAFDPRLTYLFQAGLESDPPQTRPDDVYTSPGSHLLRDYYLNYEASNQYLQIRIGKFRTPFSRQQLMSTSQMQFYDQSRANDQFQLTNTGRDVGIMLHNGFSNRIEWALAAVSKGVVGRVGFNYNGIDGYEMSDFTGGDLRFAVAANGFLHSNYTTAKLDDIRGGADFVAKIAGFSTNGALYYQYAKKENQTEGVNNLGGGADLGYLINKQIEPVLRYSWIKEAGEQSPHRHEVLAGANYYIYGHHLKVQGYAGTNLANTTISKWLGGVQFQLAL